MLHDAELFTVGPDEVVVTFRTDDEREVETMVGDIAVTTSGRYHAARVTGLDPDTTYPLSVEGAASSPLLPPTATTLPDPPGRRLATVATVNDVHFGETECGLLGTPEELGPIFRAADGEEPYPEVMNRGAIRAIEQLDADAVIVKGDLTDRGSEDEYAEFLRAYTALGRRMHHVRGNHDAMITETIAADAPTRVDVPGATLAVLDTVRPGTDRGRISAEQLDWLDALARESVQPVLVFGHHHPWDPASRERSDLYFGINPDDSEALCAVIQRREAIAGYFAGHTHRTRVRHFPAARNVPIVEIACVKDYPGAWAEYRIHEGGYTQLTRRIDAPDALAWTEKTRAMFAGLYRDYALGRLEDRCFSRAF
ncbi:MAG TPA: metallophosphoesterase family protein [Acidimicrobiia bacterium]|nr:metallophosphoesterase family protein [Acidimicrobiia bacterium]